MSAAVIDMIIIIIVVIATLCKVIPDRLNQFLKSTRKSIEDLLALVNFNSYLNCIFR